MEREGVKHLWCGIKLEERQLNVGAFGEARKSRFLRLTHFEGLYNYSAPLVRPQIRG